MRIASLVLSVVLCAFVFAGPAAADHHEMAAPAAAVTFILDAGGNVAQAVKFANQAGEIAKKLDSQGKQRVFSVAFGGPTSDHVVVVVEFPNMVALAESSGKITASPAYQKLTAEVRAAGIRLISRSVMVEVGK